MTLRFELERILGSLPQKRNSQVEFGIPARVLEQVADKYTNLVRSAEWRCANDYHRRRLIEDLCNLQSQECAQLGRLLNEHISRRLLEG